jgi:hypothetical protein
MGVSNAPPVNGKASTLALMIRVPPSMHCDYRDVLLHVWRRCQLRQGDGGQPATQDTGPRVSNNCSSARCRAPWRYRLPYDRPGDRAEVGQRF